MRGSFWVAAAAALAVLLGLVGNLATSVIDLPPKWATIAWVAVGVMGPAAVWLAVREHRTIPASSGGGGRTARQLTSAQAREVVGHLAERTWEYWVEQAKNRRITTPSPVSVRWRWAHEDVAVSPEELQPDRATFSGGMVLGESTGRVLTAGVVTELRERLYQRLSEKERIVILGEAGAGKTGAMLLLLIDILEDIRKHPPGLQDPVKPVPVWLTLGGWNPTTTSLLDWAAATVIRNYPSFDALVHGSADTVRGLLRTGRLALFLDGLDEMAVALQGPALDHIEQKLTGVRVVLTSRPAEYRAALAHGRLYSAAVVDVLPVDVRDATTFLLAQQIGQQRRDWEKITEYLIAHPDSVAARTLSTPLALSLARDVYKHTTPVDLLKIATDSTTDGLLQHLLARTLDLAYPDHVERDHATNWLSWVASHMATTDLRWWDIPTWIPIRQRNLAFGLVVGLAIGLVSGLAIGLVKGLATGLTFGFEVWLGVALVGKLKVLRTEPRAAVLRWPTSREFRTKIRHWVVSGLKFGLAIGLAIGLGVGLGVELGLGFELVAGLEVGLGVGLVGGLAFGFAFGLVEVWARPLPTARAVDPLVVYRSDRRCTITSGLGGGLVSGLVSGLTVGLVSGPTIGLVATLAIALVGALICGLLFGQGVAVELIAAELWWWSRRRRVRFIPLLQTALDRQILRQAGAVYQFRHTALQDFLKAHRMITTGESFVTDLNCPPLGNQP